VVRSSRKLILSCAALSTALAIAGCSSSSSSNGASAGTANTGQSTAGGTQGKTISFVPGVIGNAFYISMECSIRAEAQKFGFEINLQGASKFDASLQIPVLNAVVAQNPAGLIIAPDDSKALFGPISNAAKAGAKVALVDTTLTDTSSAITSIATDNVQGGAAAADSLATLIGGKGKVMVLAFQPGAATSDDRQKGFEQEIQKYPNIDYVGPQITNNDPAKAASEVSATLAAHPDLAGIYATNDRSAEGAATGLRNADKAGTVKMVAFDAGPEQIQQLQQGLVQTLIAQQPRQIGANAVDAIAAALTGKPVQKAVTTKTITVTKDNLGQPDVQAALYKLSC